MTSCAQGDQWLTEFPRPTASGGHKTSSMHSGVAPTPPFALLVIQTVFFSAMLWEFSAALSLSAKETVSRTEMRPAMVKVLFLAWIARAAWAASAHSQQLVWQVWLNWVSGTADNELTCVASALYSKAWLSPPPSTGSSVNSQGHSRSGKATDKFSS